MPLFEGTKNFPDTIHAFYARKLRHMNRMPQDTIIVYEQVVLNEGGYYNGNVGQYVAPISGIYVFVMNLLTVHPSQTSWVRMRLNGNEVSQAYAAFSTNDQSASMSAILYLEERDEVHTVLLAERTLHGNGWSHWGGFILGAV